MSRGEGQSDFVFEKPRDPEDLPMPEAAKPVMLPKASLWSKMASSRATKWVFIFVAFVLFALLVLTLVGPHIPSGE